MTGDIADTRGLEAGGWGLGKPVVLRGNWGNYKRLLPLCSTGLTQPPVPSPQPQPPPYDPRHIERFGIPRSCSMRMTTDGLAGRSCAAPLTSQRPGPPGRSDFAQAPFIVIWEVTRACALACVHCRADAIPRRNPHELTTEEGFRLIDQVRAFGDPPPLFVLTGGDPMRRPDLLDLVSYASDAGTECGADAERHSRRDPQAAG